MSKQVYISADYAEDSGDRDVVGVLSRWGSDSQHKVDFRLSALISKPQNIVSASDSD